jgi:hypothetical protein
VPSERPRGARIVAQTATSIRRRALAPTSYNHRRRPCESGCQASQTAIPPSTPGKGSDSASAATASRSTRVSRRQGRIVTVS